MHWNRKLTRTMEIHRTKHDQAYIGNVNAALDGSGLESKSSEELISDLNAVPEANAL
jgi:Fe-Mn family superoxide dismutase